jgi:hypothetical protein
MNNQILGRLVKVGNFFLFGLASLAVAKELQLRNDSLAQTEHGRQLLKYMVTCALPETDSVFVTVDGKKYTFQGKLGWVPGWIDRAMTDAEKHRMSACIAAHTNFFGKTVQISLRSDDPAAPQGFQTTAAERKAYPFFEAGFFGNYFVGNPVSYVCIGDLSAEREKHLEDLLRVCSLEHKTVIGFSRCNFKIVGLCKDKPFVQEGVDYSKEVLWVYLPGATAN